MGIDDNFHICERCEVQAGENNHTLANFKKYDIDELLCRDCREKIERENNVECPQCKKVITDGNLHFDNTGSVTYCHECHMENITKDATKRERKHFIKSNWKFWITIAIAVAFGIVGLSLL